MDDRTANSPCRVQCRRLPFSVPKHRVERSSEEAYLFRRMAMVLRQLLTLCLAAAFFVGATVQLLPSSTALADVGVPGDKMAGCDGPATASLTRRG